MASTSAAVTLSDTAVSRRILSSVILSAPSELLIPVLAEKMTDAQLEELENATKGRRDVIEQKRATKMKMAAQRNKLKTKQKAKKKAAREAKNAFDEFLEDESVAHEAKSIGEGSADTSPEAGGGADDSVLWSTSFIGSRRNPIQRLDTFDRANRRRDEETAAILVSNLSENMEDNDLLDLFRPFGHIARIFLAKDKMTGQCKGFAFINYYKQEDAAKAIATLNGFGYDHLILNVEWAKPSNR